LGREVAAQGEKVVLHVDYEEGGCGWGEGGGVREGVGGCVGDLSGLGHCACGGGGKDGREERGVVVVLVVVGECL
jgi:hypothetical protein